jgi:hypothetical protein
MSRFATDEIPENLYNEFIDGLLEGTIGKYRKELAKKFKEIAIDLKTEEITSPNLLRKLYQMSLVYKNLLEKKKLQRKKPDTQNCMLN